MALYINENEYPQNYDWLPQEKQQAIVDTMNELYQDKLETFGMARSKSSALTEEYHNFLEEMWKNKCQREYGMMDMLDALGIKVEYDWVGHRGTHFLATYDDALAQQDYYNDTARDDEGDVDEYLSGGDCGNK